MSVPAFAQTASQITPPSYSPAVVDAAPAIEIPQGSGITAPPGAENLSVTLSDVVVDGEDVSPDALNRLRTRLVGRRVTVAEVFDAARELEAGYGQRGQVLVRVSVPAQQLNDGATLRLVVTRGFVESIDTASLPANIQRRVATLLAPLAGRSDLTLAQIERRLSLAGDVPGTTLRSALAAGSKPGGTVLVISADYRPVDGFISADNRMSEALGRNVVGLGVNFNSVLGLGEMVYLRASGFPNGGREVSILHSTPRNRSLAGGVIIPLGSDGLSLNLEATDARAAPRHSATALGTASKFERYSARLTYPFLRSRSFSLLGDLAFDAQREEMSIISPQTAPFSLDRMRVIRGGGTVVAALPAHGSISARVEGSFGIHGLGARSASEATYDLPLSRQGADAKFQKLNFNLALRQPMGSGFQITMKGSAQTTFGDALLNAEQFGIATSDGVSPLPSGFLQGDTGYVGRAELARDFTANLGGGFTSISPYVFGAKGEAHLKRPTYYERINTEAHAYGAGVRLALASQDGSPSLSASVEWGRAHVDDMRRSDRTHFTIISKF